WVLSGKENPESEICGIFFQIVAVLCATLLILSSSVQMNTLLSMRWLVYVGDISYVLYLIHWPIIVLHHISTFILNFSGIMTCIIISIALSILIHHTFEKPLQSQSFGHCFSISMVFYACVFIALAWRLPQKMSTQIIHFRQGFNSTLSELMQWNYKESIACCNTLPEDCTSDEEVARWTGLPELRQSRCVMQGNGTHKVLVVGNSVSMSSFSTVHRSLDGRYSTLRLFSQAGCWMLFGRCDSWEASVYWQALQAVVEQMKPDIILITESQRLMNERPHDDSVLLHAQKRIDYLSSHSRAVMVDTQYLIPDFPHSSALAHSLASGRTEMSGLRRPLEEVLSLKRVAYERIIALRGNNLVVNNIAFAFCERIEGVCEGYNPTTLRAYTQSGAHINSYGYELLGPFYRRSLKRIYEIVSQT
ncbi:hypothetical protein PMAYCL1PPCAC_33004, partial [Pristionchus mayeri]